MRSTNRFTAAVTGCALALLAALSLGACGGDSDGDGDEEPVGVPNPASVFCEEEGGTVVIVTDDDGGQRGICQLPDGTEVDEWEYYREHHPSEG